MTPIHVAISLLPVVFFLAALMLLDSYKLVRPKAVFITLAVGCAAAGASYFIAGWIRSGSGIQFQTYSNFIAPFVEEMLKGAFVAYLVISNRVGFTVDAAIQGFAVGAGFAVVENIYYLTELSDANLRVWVVRGLGTAIMHGGVMAVFAILTKSVRDRLSGARFRPVLLALLAAVILHSAYNLLAGQPLIGTSVLIIAFPPIMSALFHESEKRTRSWLGTGFDTDQELLKLIRSGDISETRVGEYLLALKDHFEGAIVADMLCLIQIRVELSLKAKGIMMMREAGFQVKPDPMTRRQFSELKYLEKSIGKTGLLAIEPVHRWTTRDLWQLNLLGDAETISD